jgi:tetratricopeptide (TPR) repeat protein/predicted Ser/Thr protein kinase
VDRCLDADTLAGYVDGALAPEVSRHVDTHIDRCTTCREELSALIAAGTVPGARKRAEPGLYVAGDCIGRYRVVRQHASGGMGVILIAHDPELDREIALKLLRPEVSDRERLQLEARAMARLAHPNVVRVYDVIDDDEELAVAMELVVGKDLGAWVRERARPWREKLQACLDAGRGLAGAHAAGLVHRDFKPENVLVADDGRVLVTDFGLASALDGDTNGRRVLASALDGDTNRRRVFAGTPRYMAPELFDGAAAATAASDEFAFCVTTWEVLFGERPYPGSTWEELSRRVRTGELAPAPRSAVPARIRAALARGLSPDPAARFGSMTALLAALSPSRVRPWHVAVVAGGIATVTAAALLFARGDDRPSCEVTAGALVGAWDPAIDATIHEAFVATGHRRGAAIADLVSTRVQRYADAWRAARTEACTVTQNGEQSAALLDLRMQCLDRRKQELAALTRLFADEPDVAVLDRAPTAVDQLPRVETCDAEQAGTRAPLPDDLGRRAKLAAVRSMHADAEAMRIAGRTKHAAVLLEEVVTQAKAVDYSPLLVDAAQSLGLAYTSLSKFDEAEKLLYEALQAAEASGDHVGAATAWISLLNAVGGQQQKRDTADVYTKAAQAKLSGFNANAALRGRFAYVLATVELGRARYKEARTLLGEARDLFAQHYGTDHASAGDVHGGLCMAHQNLGELDDALRECERSVAIHDKLSPDDPNTAFAINMYASVLLAKNQLDEAAAQYRRAIDIADRALGPQSLVRAISLNNIAIIHRRKGEYDKALENARASLEAFERYHPKHPQITSPLSTLANTLLDLGRTDEGIRNLEKGREIAIAKLGADHPTVARADYNIAIVYVDQGDHTRAKPLLQRTLDASRRSMGTDNRLAARVLNALAAIARDERRLADAIELCKEALAMIEKLVGPEHADLVSPLTTLGDVLLDSNHAGAALVHLERAMRLQGKEGEPRLRAVTLFAHARASWLTNTDREQAVQHVREARDLLAPLETSDELRRRVDRWLAAHE